MYFYITFFYIFKSLKESFGKILYFLVHFQNNLPANFLQLISLVTTPLEKYFIDIYFAELQ